MEAVSIQNALMLVLAAGMMAVGGLGLTGRITDTTPVIVGCFLVAVVLAFSLGRQSRDLF